MATFVIVHGGWAGGWYMRPLADCLRSAGAVVYTPTLTGQGERSHLVSRDVGLPTYVQDIVNVLVYEDLHDVILVGKSGSGIAITGVAEQTPERIACLVYLNAFVPEDGQSLAGLVGPEVTQQMESRARAYDGWRVPPQPGIDPRISPQPLRLFTDRVRLQNPAAARLPRAYIWGTAHPETPIYAPLRRVAAQARVGGWIYRELPSGHEPERQMPEELSRVLLEVTAEVEKGHQ